MSHVSARLHVCAYSTACTRHSDAQRSFEENVVLTQNFQFFQTAKRNDCRCHDCHARSREREAWLPKQLVLWGTNDLQASAIWHSALSMALTMRSSTCRISTGTCRQRSVKKSRRLVCQQVCVSLCISSNGTTRGRDSHVVSFPSCFKYRSTALILHLFP